MTDVSDSVPQDDALNPPTFDILPLSAETRTALAKMGYEHPTPVQRAVFDPATRGKDLVVQARTGTGKTTAFGLPIVEQGVRRSLKAVQVLGLCPTRELALQVAAEIEKLGEGRGIKPVAIYGGAPMGKQMDALAAGAQVVVGTPGRVLDHIRRGTLDTSNIRMLVLDEADEMLSMGFERELTAILDTLPKERQTLLFSATLPPDIERMSRERLKSPEFITLSGDAIGALSIAHYVYFVLEDKVTTLLKIIEVENPESAIVFCNTKADTEVVAAALQRAGYDADWLNGDLPQSDREIVMGKIRRSELRFLVATDVAARGIDISHLTHVINFDFPDSAEQYVHRTGRTGRAGRTGTAIALVRPQDIGNVYVLRLTYKIKPFERTLPSAGDLKTRREADLVQMVADSFPKTPVHPDDLSLARRLLSHDSAESIVARLLRDRLGERQVSEESSAAARRAKNPPPFTEPRRQVGEGGASERRDDRGPPRGRDDRGPRGRDDRGPPRGRDDRGPPRGRDDRGPPRGRDDRRDEPRSDRRDDSAPRGQDDREPGRPPAPVAAAPAPAVVAPVVAQAAPQPTAEPRPAAATPTPPAVEQPAAAPAAQPSQSAAPAAAVAGEQPGSRTSREASSWEVSPYQREGERRRRGHGRERSAAPSTEEPIRYTISEPEALPYARPATASSTPPDRPSDLVNWHPAEEEGDDRPIFTGGKPGERPQPPQRSERGEREGRGGERDARGGERDARGGDRDARGGERASRGVEREARVADAERSPEPRVSERAEAERPERSRSTIASVDPTAGAMPLVEPPPEGGFEDDDGLELDEAYAVVFVDVGRRDGARPADLQRVLRDRGGISRRETGRIRVRDKHALVSVRREVLTRAIEALTGAEIAGKTVKAEPARERSAEAT
jgi:ATP-dependent RNA helicase DeaD